MAGLYPPVTHCPSGHEYTTENTYLYKNRRSCRQCRKDAAPRRNAERRAKRRLKGIPAREFVVLVCVDCSSEFNGETGNKGQMRCRRCYQRWWRANNTEYYRAYSREYQAKNREKTRAKIKKWAENNRGRCHMNSLRNRLRTDFGMPLQEYLVLVNKQDGVCAICLRPESKMAASGHPANLSVDHDHGSMMVRELLCNRCNTTIGKACDSPKLLRAMADYIDKHRGGVK